MEAEAAQSVQAVSSQNRILWIGDLKEWMNENYIRHCYPLNRDFVSIKVMRNKKGKSKGYGFVEFRSHAAAAKFLETHIIVSQFDRTEKLFSFNWGALGDKDMRSTYDVFVGGLSPVITSGILKQIFSVKYESVEETEVVIDKITGWSRGFGFVRFANEMDQVRALKEMDGVVCYGRVMRVGPALAKAKKFEAVSSLG